MRRLAWVVLLLAACTPKPPLDPELASRLAEFDETYENVRIGSGNSLRALKPQTSRDFRGRTVDQDMEQWVFAPETRKRIEAAREYATSLRGEPAYAALRTADLLVKAEVDRAARISLYWDGARPGLYWRDYWQAFFEANGAPTPAPDARLLDQERQVRAALVAGDFSKADAEASRLATALRESLSGAARRFPSKDKPAALEYVPRKAPCGPPIQPIPWQDKAKHVGGESIESFYPPAAIRRGEEGGVVLRLRIARTGCVTAAALVVHSGVPALDSAALQWFEASRFAPASSNGRAIDSELSLRIVFRLEDSEPAK
jgi:TonB family protein